MSTSYEQFVQGVYQLLVDQDAVRNVEVQHNVTLTGRSGATHQIDVFWQFQIAGQLYRTCVECKRYTSTVKKTHVAAFTTVLEDIGNANGIFVTTEGYQKGARLLAKGKNIRLIRLNPVIREVHIQMNLQVPEYKSFSLEFDVPAVKAILANLGRTSYQYSVRGGDAVLRNSQTGELSSLEKAIGPQPSVGGTYRIDLSNYSVQTELAWMPLTAATYELEYSEIKDTMVVKPETAVNAILEDVLANTQSYVHDDGTLLPFVDEA